MEFRKLSTTVDRFGNCLNTKIFDLYTPIPLVQQANNVEIGMGIEILEDKKYPRYIIKSRPTYIIYIEKNKELYDIWVIDVKYLDLLPKDYFNCQKPNLLHHL